MSRFSVIVPMLGLLCASATAAPATRPSMHPRFGLLDASGQSVQKSGGPVSTMRTCGTCHDTNYIATHSYHVDAKVEGARHVGGGHGAGGAEMNCFLCHLPNPDNGARIGELKAGRREWAASATLGQTNLGRRDGDAWKWDGGAFAEDGLIATAFPMPRAPVSANCGQCHTQVHTSSAPMVVGRDLRQRATLNTGQVFASQRLKDSAMNLAGKERLGRAWDVHAERLLECTSCHNSLNNPAHHAGAEHARPEHLKFEGRRLTVGQYLLTPSHDFAKGDAPQSRIAPHLAGSMRRCEDCHDAGASHERLPYPQRHFQAMDCEACHVPQVYAPARQMVDATVVDLAGQPVVTYRGVNGAVDKAASLVTGYRPVLLPRTRADGTTKLTPHNLVSSWRWVGGKECRPVYEAELRKAYLNGGEYHATVSAALDTNRNGKVDPGELRLDTSEKTEAVRKRLVEIGVENPRIVGEIQPYSLHHSIAGGEWAVRKCGECHDERSRVSERFELAAYVPGGVVPSLVEGVNVKLAGEIWPIREGNLEYHPSSAAAGLYVIGHDRWAMGDVLGLLAIIGAAVGSVVHGTMRVISARKRRSA